MDRKQFIEGEDKHVTVCIVSEDGVFNRLLNTVPAADGASFQALAQDLAGVGPRMIVKLPEGKRGVVQGIVAGDAGVNTVTLAAPGNKSAEPAPTVTAAPGKKAEVTEAK